jgi:DNA primase large subunit
MICEYCYRDRNPFPCMNTRDMTDAAIGGSDACMAALEKCGWGESGERYVRLNRQKERSKDAGL